MVDKLICPIQQQECNYNCRAYRRKDGVCIFVKAAESVVAAADVLVEAWEKHEKEEE